MFPRPKMWPKLLVAAVAAILLFKSPETAASLANSGIHALRQGIDALASFATHLKF